MINSDVGEIISILLSKGILREKDVLYARRIQEKLTSPQPLLNILKDLKLVTDDVVRETIQQSDKTIRIGEMLVELGHISKDDLLAAFNIKKEDESDLKIGEILIKYNFIEAGQFNSILSMQLGYPLVYPTLANVDRKAVEKASLNVLRRNKFLPLKKKGDETVAALSDPTDLETITLVKKLFGNQVILALSDQKALRDTIRFLEQQKDGTAVIDIDNKTVVGIANSIILAAIKADASDIHIEPLNDKLQVRFRLDGVLSHYQDFPKDVILPLSSRLKIMCKANIAEKRRHQGGRMLFDYDEGKVDIRASFYITVHGEKTVLRLLRQKQELIDIRSLGMPSRILNRFLEEALCQPGGVLLVTGPTGSGKTSTVYGCIHYINSPQISIITAEEPVEYLIDGVAQCSIDPVIDLTFEETLRHIVRQDPDVIMIGEIRDKYSADMAMQAALTGHKVLSTFHTEDSIGGLIRLLHMDIAPFLVASTVVSVVAQRLLRKVCPSCAEPAKITPAQLQRLGCSYDDLASGSFMKGRGCRECRQTGYQGRVGVFELLVLNELIKAAILEQKPSHEIRSIAIEHAGLVTLFEDGLVKAALGITTIDEIVRCLPRLMAPRPLQVIQRLCGDV
ncbi:GspE/PulE family protein [Desulfosediminicola flagellatus]|uniref:GspE/PulE family protein n=1 Tax=Desulfosediminicola flagellatus TaxID=2569541 RepID=UPI0015943497|nr:GspE/PulE family protein [Desulfosediminicola flagellatus]